MCESCEQFFSKKLIFEREQLKNLEIVRDRKDKWADQPYRYRVWCQTGGHFCKLTEPVIAIYRKCQACGHEGRILVFYHENQKLPKTILACARCRRGEDDVFTAAFSSDPWL